MDQNYTYPIILDFSDDEIIDIILPDFGNVMTCVSKGEDYITAAQDFLSLTILDLENENKELPKRSEIEKLKIKRKQQMVYINIWMPYHRSKVKEVFVKKTLTVPAWLDVLAKNNNINFSSILVKALKKELDIKK
ncbi:type II toxin-antitoxin system HicB family antitoxin [Aquibacillus halophilus]|uniref:Type II toxin-antitoxin system HicB family antitoxin n=1 Tax=Aquibacillus halophilus TaxID=930132 RepID=A0A6A8DCR1_9BACI|nr:type II toxin-antitoxin system HicB family antitoxin [Aquibacillus halophilus]MRH43344.1 type II toxin-antitoxin system HicB family antitoxin [Aquibacillus halophilus]